jgi:hypothetical protein
MAGGGIDDLNAEKVDLLELVWSERGAAVRAGAAKLC